MAFAPWSDRLPSTSARSRSSALVGCDSVRQLAPRNRGCNPAPVCRFDEAGVIKRARLDIEVDRVRFRSRVDGRATLRAEMPRQLVAAICFFCEGLRRAGDQPKAAAFDANTHVERASRRSSAVFAVTIVGRSKRPTVFVADVSTQTMTRHNRGHPALPLLIWVHDTLTLEHAPASTTTRPSRSCTAPRTFVKKDVI